MTVDSPIVKPTDAKAIFGREEIPNPAISKIDLSSKSALPPQSSHEDIYTVKSAAAQDLAGTETLTPPVIPPLSEESPVPPHSQSKSFSEVASASAATLASAAVSSAKQAVESSAKLRAAAATSAKETASSSAKLAATAVTTAKETASSSAKLASTAASTAKDVFEGKYTCTEWVFMTQL